VSERSARCWDTDGFGVLRRAEVACDMLRMCGKRPGRKCCFLSTEGQVISFAVCVGVGVVGS
jgi:hypothetical protein